MAAGSRINRRQQGKAQWPGHPGTWLIRSSQSKVLVSIFSACSIMGYIHKNANYEPFIMSFSRLLFFWLEFVAVKIMAAFP